MIQIQSLYGEFNHRRRIRKRAAAKIVDRRSRQLEHSSRPSEYSGSLETTTGRDMAHCEISFLKTII